MGSLKIHALIIDPQVDFMDQPGSALGVAGATDDTKRLAAFVSRVGDRLDDIHVTLDSHHLLHIANPGMWKNSQGQNPAPFTQITADDVANGLWTPAIPSPDLQKWQRSYVETLATNGRYPLVIWPPHCLIGSMGHTVQADLFQAITAWEGRNSAVADYVTKGSNYRTEHYSAVKAEVPDPADPNTNLNMGLIQTLQDADIVVIGGQALSHCVANTVRDIAAVFGPTNIEKLHLLRDCTSSVGGFDALGDDFVTEMTSKGMKVVDSTTFLA